MGRRKDDPAEQAAKGYPGKRRAQTDRAIEAAAASAEEEASAGDPFAVPAVFQNAHAYYRRAIKLWNAQAETLRAAGRRRPGYRGALTRYCIWMQIHESAIEQLRRECPKGDFVIAWTPVNGTTRMIEHPSLKIMSRAEPILRALEDDFGFTPRADSALVRVESFNQSQQQGDLFGAGGARRPADDGQPDQGGDPLDLMTSTDGAPPVLN